MKLTLGLLSMCLLVGSVVAAETNTESVLPVDVTQAVIKGVNYLRAQAATNEDGWLFPALDTRKLVGWATNDVHYKEVKVTIPGYKYEDYEVLVPGSTPAEPMRKVVRSRIVGLDPSKDHTETNLVFDPNGPIIRHDIPLYEKGGVACWAYGALGNNALAILALRRCGVRDDDPVVSQPANKLAWIVATFGVPDNLHDLAWLTAGFAVLSSDNFKELTERCAAKLLDAQITSGPATGLWGPVAVNPQMLSAFLRVMSRLGDEKKKLAANLALEQTKHTKGKPTVKARQLEEEIQTMDARITALQDDASRITQLGLLMFDVFGARTFGAVTLTYQGDSIRIESLPYLVHNQISADLDSTALAIFALRVASENGRLPAKTWRPESSKVQAVPGAPPAAPDFPPARTAREVIDLTAKAVTAARTPAGQWTELNVYQPVTDLAWLKSMPQVKPELFPKLPQPITLPSVCRGAAILANIQILQTGQAPGTVLETETCRSLVADLIRGQLSLLVTNDVGSPYNVLPQLVAPRNSRGKMLRADFSAWNDLADWVVRQQVSTNGNWGRENTHPGQFMVSIPSTSLRALRQVIPPIAYEPAAVTANTMIKNYDKPHLAPGYFAWWDTDFGAPEADYFTTTALLFLADGLPEGWTPPLPPVTVPAP